MITIGRNQGAAAVADEIGEWWYTNFTGLDHWTGLLDKMV